MTRRRPEAEIELPTGIEIPFDELARVCYRIRQAGCLAVQGLELRRESDPENVADVLWCAADEARTALSKLAALGVGVAEEYYDELDARIPDRDYPPLAQA